MKDFKELNETELGFVSGGVDAVDDYEVDFWVDKLTDGREDLSVGEKYIRLDLAYDHLSGATIDAIIAKLKNLGAL